MLHFGVSITHCVAIFLVHTTSFWDRHQMMYDVHEGSSFFPCPTILLRFTVRCTAHTHTPLTNTVVWCIIHSNTIRGAAVLSSTPSRPRLYPPQYIVHLKISWFLPVVAYNITTLTPHTLHKSFTYIFRKIYGSAWRGGGVTNPSMRGAISIP